MIAEYRENIYFANIRCTDVRLLTYCVGKSMDSFEPKRDYFKKSVNIDDADLISLYDLHFYVRYKDPVEEPELWLIDEGRAVGKKGNIEKNEVVIDVPHDARGGSWIQYEKGSASKMIHLSDCSEFIVEKTYKKFHGKIVDNMVESISVTPTAFAKAVIANRRMNL